MSCQGGLRQRQISVHSFGSAGAQLSSTLESCVRQNVMPKLQSIICAHKIQRSPPVALVTAIATSSGWYLMLARWGLVVGCLPALFWRCRQSPWEGTDLHA